MESRAKEILDSVMELFKRYGIKSPTMDDIARHLRISKKTLYKHVKDKQDLVAKAMALNCQRETEALDAIRNRGLNAIDENFEVSKFVVEMLRGIHPSVHYDLEKYYPDAWKIFYEHKSTHVYGCVRDNLERGVEEGLYREGLNIPIIARIYTWRIDMVFDGELFPSEDFDFSDVYLEMFRYHIRGVASKKGVEYLEKKIENNEFDI